jgi:hypothetical protein
VNEHTCLKLKETSAPAQRSEAGPNPLNRARPPRIG